ncbi:hypothetical protein BCR32DRAFT_330263 [Anaeromyces robustus]|uniref:Uncharacterized protein n=1 Tax=Anaeromyces robustus TaxID=1754192 RepID=A0A1Y1W174_9FUNG|nr:hypothetical protein BCR32DRAFT_330263 [Anaeromyces robustus]|eukprot:ORX66976.1 hypothetical protein BCR32DRAFT_330263 [Anaeromyces robustus]
MSTLQWSIFVQGKSIPKELPFPVLYDHVYVNNGKHLSVTSPGKIYENNELIGAVNNDYPIDECIYNVSDNTVTCQYMGYDSDIVNGKVQNYNNKYTLTYTVELKDKNKCLSKSNTKIDKITTYTYNKEEKKYNETEYVAYYDFENNKIVGYTNTLKKIDVTTKNKCTFTLTIKKSKLKVVIKKAKN